MALETAQSPDFPRRMPPGVDLSRWAD